MTYDADRRKRPMNKTALKKMRFYITEQLIKEARDNQVKRKRRKGD